MKIVIIGGVAGGASAAARARRLNEHAEIIMIQSGPDVSYASCGMPYFIGKEITDRASMAVQTPASLHKKLNLDVRVNSRVVDINTDQQFVRIHPEKPTERHSCEYTESYDHLILAVGAAPLKPPIPGIDRPGLFALRNLEDMDEIDQWLRARESTNQKKKLYCVVAGAGFVGLEMVEQLHRRNCNVTLVELQDQILAPLDPEMAAILHQDLNEKPGVTVIVSDGIKEFKADPEDNRASLLTLQSGRVLPSADLTILGLGVRPDTKVVQDAGIACSPRGHIQVNSLLQTNIANVWAVGDAVEVENPLVPPGSSAPQKWAVPLAGPANRQGRLVADNILLPNARSYKGTYGASIVRSFDLMAGSVGLNEKFLAAYKIPYRTVHLHPKSHAGYYPGASSLHLKILFDHTGNNGYRIYGGQVVGGGGNDSGVDKRIDVLAVAVQAGWSVDDLADVELSYAPPIGSAKDPINLAGMLAQNVVRGMVEVLEWNDLDQRFADEQRDYGKIITQVVDVRSAAEVAKLGLLTKKALHIPLPDLRSRLGELDPSRPVLVSCQTGQRSYYAYRILKQSGFDRVENLDGAYATFHTAHPDAL